MYHAPVHPLIHCSQQRNHRMDRRVVVDANTRTPPSCSHVGMLALIALNGPDGTVPYEYDIAPFTPVW
jgi:hypothetical protein